MKRPKGLLAKLSLSIFGFLLLLLATYQPPVFAAVLYKSYLVKYDRGWDILCDPYVVQKDDWVYKIFRQKGELSAKDFREFLSIFRRLNPHIQNIDRIRPNQHIIIPLKKIEPGTFPDQASGTVTIPFVTISKVTDLINSYASSYEVRRGDSISKLLSKQFGQYGSKSYQEGVQLFKTINPQVVDLNFIYVGQQLKLPESAIQNQAWYQSLFDKAGRIKKELGGTTFGSPPPPAPTAVVSEVTSTEDPISETVAALDGKLRNRGTYFFPRKGEADFELDLSRFPVMELKDGTRIVFANKTDAARADLDELPSLWDKVRIIDVEEDSQAQTLLSSIQETETAMPLTEVTFSDYGLNVTVTAKWIKASPPDPDGIVRHTCISSIEAKSQRTPDTIIRYLDQHNIVIKDILENKTLADMQPDTASSDPYVLPDILALVPIQRKAFARDLIEALGGHYAKDIAVSFPYAGIQIQAVSNLVSTPSGKEFLLDFGDLYGDAVQEIEKTGLKVVQIKHDTDIKSLISIILSELEESYINDPILYAARRPVQFNTKMSFKGFMVTKQNGSRILISVLPLHNSILQFLNQDKIKVILVGVPA
jgi:hypothetical protein